MTDLLRLPLEERYLDRIILAHKHLKDALKDKMADEEALKSPEDASEIELLQRRLDGSKLALATKRQITRQGVEQVRAEVAKELASGWYPDQIKLKEVYLALDLLEATLNEISLEQPSRPPMERSGAD